MQLMPPSSVGARVCRTRCASPRSCANLLCYSGSQKSCVLRLMQIADFGTTQWAQNTTSTGLATYTRRGQGIRLSLPWAAPEVSLPFVSATGAWKQPKMDLGGSNFQPCILYAASRISIFSGVKYRNIPSTQVSTGSRCRSLQ